MDAVRVVTDVAVGRVRFVRFLWFVSLAFVVGEYLRPPLAHALRHETLLWNYASAIEVSLAGALALLAAALSRYASAAGRAARPRPFFLLATGLALLFIGADEMLAWHERLGKHMAANRWLEAVSVGNAVDGAIVLCYGIGGLLFALWMLKDILADRTAARYYGIAALCAVYSVLSDYLPRAYLASFLPNCFEEITELFFGVALASAAARHVERFVQVIIDGLTARAAFDGRDSANSPDARDDLAVRPYM